MVETYFRINDFATINKIRQKNVRCKFLVQRFCRGNEFGTLEKFQPKTFDETFWFKPISEEMILQP